MSGWHPYLGRVYSATPEYWDRYGMHKPGRYEALNGVLLRLSAGPCTYCRGRADTLDHVKPRARGGTHHLSNLHPACRSCNSSKSARTPEEWRG